MDPLSLAKMVVIVWPKMPHNLSAQFVCPSPKKASSGVRSPCLQGTSQHRDVSPFFSFFFFDFTIASTNWVDKPHELSWQASRCKGWRGCRGCSKYVVEQVLLSRHRCTILRSLYVCSCGRNRGGGNTAAWRTLSGQIAKNPPKITFEKMREIEWSYLFLQQYDKFSMWSLQKPEMEMM